MAKTALASAYSVPKPKSAQSLDNPGVGLSVTTGVLQFDREHHPAGDRLRNSGLMQGFNRYPLSGTNFRTLPLMQYACRLVADHRRGVAEVDARTGTADFRCAACRGVVFMRCQCAIRRVEKTWPATTALEFGVATKQHFAGDRIDKLSGSLLVEMRTAQEFSALLEGNPLLCRREELGTEPLPETLRVATVAGSVIFPGHSRTAGQLAKWRWAAVASSLLVARVSVSELPESLPASDRECRF